MFIGKLSVIPVFPAIIFLAHSYLDRALSYTPVPAAEDFCGVAQLMWDETALFLLATITDDVPQAPSTGTGSGRTRSSCSSTWTARERAVTEAMTVSMTGRSGFIRLRTRPAS